MTARVVAYLDREHLVAEAPDGQGRLWLFVGGLERLPAEHWGCACWACAGVAEQLPRYEGGYFRPLAFTYAHIARTDPSGPAGSARPVGPEAARPEGEDPT